MNELLTNKIYLKEQTDKLYKWLETLKQYEFPLTHTFTPGLYTRKIFMPKGSFLISKIHNTEHQFFVMKGKVKVLGEDGKLLTLQGGDSGITKPGTCRIIHVLEDCYWVTSHPTNIQPENNSKEAVKKAVDLIERQIIDKRVIELSEQEFNYLEYINTVPL